MSTSTHYKDEFDNRWICWKCGDLALLDNSGLCHWCKPEKKVTEFYEICCRALCGQKPEPQSVWKIA